VTKHEISRKTRRNTEKYDPTSPGPAAEPMRNEENLKEK